MKKLLFWTALASVALTGCVKNDVEPNPSLGQDVEITFNQPVVGKITKAHIGEIKDAQYPTTEQFIVHAWAHQGDFNQAASPVVYIDQQGTTHFDGQGLTGPDGDAGTYGTWRINPTYYWPKTHYLTFSAFSPAKLKDNPTYADTTKIDLVNGITLTNVKTPTDIDDHYDLLYSDRVYNQREREYTHDNDNYYGVDVLFNHALASVNVQAQWAKDYNEGILNGENKIVITDIHFENVCFQATFNENVGGNRALVNSDNRNNATWNNPTNPQSISIKANNSNNLTLNTTAQTFGVPALFIPQNLTVGGNTKLVVDYTITNTGGAELNETITFDLSDIEFTDDDDADGVWEIGKRYTYTLTFGLNEIHLAPYVDSWDPVDAGFNDVIGSI